MLQIVHSALLVMAMVKVAFNLYQDGYSQEMLAWALALGVLVILSRLDALERKLEDKEES